MRLDQFNSLLRRNLGQNIWCSIDEETGFYKVYERHFSGTFDILTVKTPDKKPCEPFDRHALEAIVKVRRRRYQKWGRSTNDLSKMQDKWVDDIKHRTAKTSNMNPKGWDTWSKRKRDMYNYYAARKHKEIMDA